MTDGELRSAVHGKNITLLKTLNLSPDQLHYLTHKGWDWLAPACLWEARGFDTMSLGCIDKVEWSMTVAGCVLASHETFDLQACQHEWSTKPARDVLYIWEDWAEVAIAAGDLDPVHREAPRKALEAKEAWCRGEINDAELDVAREAAWAARSASNKAEKAAWRASEVARASARASSRVSKDSSRIVSEVIMDSIGVASKEAAWAAIEATMDTTWSATDESRTAAWLEGAAVRKAAYAGYGLEFTLHVLMCLKNNKHKI